MVLWKVLNSAIRVLCFSLKRTKSAFNHCVVQRLQIFAIHGHIQSLVAGRGNFLREDASDALSRYESKIARALVPPKRNFIGFKHPEFDEFVRLFTETTSKIKKNEIPVGTETIFKAMKLKDALSSSWMPKSPLEKDELKQQLNDVAKSFAYDAQLLQKLGIWKSCCHRTMRL